MVSDPIYALASKVGGGSYESGAMSAAAGYLFNWLSHIHDRVTYSAALDAGLDVQTARRLAKLVKGVDFEGKSTGPMPWNVESQERENAHMHAMCTAGYSEGLCAAAYKKYMVEQWSSKTLPGLARYLHAFQDSFAEGHKFKSYDGSVSPEHIWHDANIGEATQVNMIKQTSLLIRGYMNMCPGCFK